MIQYLLLIHGNLKTEPTLGEWDQFFSAARQTGFFKGGSALGEKIVIGNTGPAESSDHLKGYMRFDAADRQGLVALVQKHPVVVHGGTAELFELPKS